jgi:molybdopterin-guanine dinucleotide biosynthesis protein A
MMVYLSALSVDFLQKTYTMEATPTIHSLGDRFLTNSAIVLSGGLSTRFGQDKGLLKLGDKPLIRYVLNAVEKLVEERIVVVSSKQQLEVYERACGDLATILTDRGKEHSPLAGTLTGLQEAQGEYSLILPCDTPFVSRNVISLLLELAPGRNACVPRWPNGYVEPLQAVYRTQCALKSCETALQEKQLDVKAMLDRLQCIRYVSTLVLQQLDPELITFFNINTPQDLKRAEQILANKLQRPRTSFNRQRR